MSIQNVGINHLVQGSGVGNLIRAAGLAAVVWGTGCAPSAPSQYEDACENLRGQVNQVLGNTKLDGQRKKESINRLAMKFAERFAPSSGEAAALQQVATIASNKIPCGPLNINGTERYFFLVLSSLLVGLGVYSFVSSDSNNKPRLLLPTVLVLAALTSASAHCTHFFGNPTSAAPAKSSLTSEDCQDAWKDAHKNQSVGPGS